MKRGWWLVVSVLGLGAAFALAQQKDDPARRHPSPLASAPESAHARSNPYEGKPEGVQAGRKLFARYCTECHGADGHGRGKAPPLNSEHVGQAPPGDLFWFLTNGNLRAGMPSWSRLPDAQRWQLVSFLKTFARPPSKAAPASP